jgi:hypothetical protein
MLAGEELLHTPLVGINRHVDGRGQCFLNSRRILLGVNECPELQRQKPLNQLIASPKMYLGLETAQQVMLNEQGIDISSIDSLCKHRHAYTDGINQSGFVELFWSAGVDDKNIILVSPVIDTPWCAVTGIIPSYHTSTPTNVYLQAGLIKEEQLVQPMILTSHGAVKNRYITSQLQHFAPIIITDKVEFGDLMEQCFIQISPDVSELKNLSSISSHTRDLANVDLESVLSSQAKTNSAQRESNIASFVARITQMRKI